MEGLQRSFRLLGKSSFPGQLPNSSDPIPGIWKESQVRRPFSESLPSAPSRTARLTHPEGGPREKPGGNQLGLLTVSARSLRFVGSRTEPNHRLCSGPWMAALALSGLLFPPAAAMSRWGRRLRLVRPPLFFLAAPALGSKSCSPRAKDFRGRVAKAKPESPAGTTRRADEPRFFRAPPGFSHSSGAAPLEISPVGPTAWRESSQNGGQGRDRTRVKTRAAQEKWRGGV